MVLSSIVSQFLLCEKLNRVFGCLISSVPKKIKKKKDLFKNTSHPIRTGIVEQKELFFWMLLMECLSSPFFHEQWELEHTSRHLCGPGIGSEILTGLKNDSESNLNSRRG